jgi:hypothetical protein
MGSAFELLCVVQKRAAALRKKIDKSHMGFRRLHRKAERPIVKKYPLRLGRGGKGLVKNSVEEIIDPHIQRR